MNSLLIQQQALGWATDLAIANVGLKLHQKEKQNGIASTSTYAPMQEALQQKLLEQWNNPCNKFLLETKWGTRPDDVSSPSWENVWRQI